MTTTLLAELQARRAVRDLQEQQSPGARSAPSEGPIAPRPIVVCLRDVQPEPIQWLWPARLALGKISLLIGDPGLGKSTISLDMAARLSTGRAWPDGCRPADPGNTLILSAEDGLADTVRPRLDALGADVTRIHHVAILRAGDQERTIQLGDVAMIEQAIQATGAQLLIIDPVSAYLGNADSHKDAAVRSLLAPIAALADRQRTAVLGVMHLKKATEGSAVHRVAGSIAFGAAARIVLAVAVDHDHGGRRVLASVKQNLAADPPALVYALDEGRLTWETADAGAVDITALLNGPESVRDRGEQTDAERVIEDLLEDDSAWPLEARSALDAGRARGINDRTLQRAAHRAGIRIERVGFGRGGRWLWHRPSGIGDSIADTPPETATVSSMSPMDPQPTNTARRDPDAPIGDTPTVTGTAAEREDDDDARY